MDPQAEELGRRLAGKKAFLAVAESCTGGLIAKRVTEAITDVTKLPKEAVWVVIEEVDPPLWYVGGKAGERMKK